MLGVAAAVAAAVVAGGGEWRLLCLACIRVGPLTRRLALRACSRGWQGGAAVLHLLGLRQGRAADAVACAACSRPRAKVGDGQRLSQVHPWTSAAVTALAGGGGAALALLGLRCGWATQRI
jgi:hypothetical protein